MLFKVIVFIVLFVISFCLSRIIILRLCLLRLVFIIGFVFLARVCAFGVRIIGGIGILFVIGVFVVRGCGICWIKIHAIGGTVIFDVVEFICLIVFLFLIIVIFTLF